MDSTIHHDPYAPDSDFDLPEPEEPTNHAEDPKAVKSVKELLGRKALNAHKKRMADVPS